MAGRDVETLLDAIEVDDTPQVDDTPHSSSQRTRAPSQKARQNLNQLESASATEAKTSRRAPRTTNGVRAEQRDADPPTADASAWQKVLEVVGTTNEEIRKLTQMVTQQQEVIKSLEKRLQETQHQLDEIKNNQAAATSVGTSPRRSYADVARTPPTSQPSNVHTLSSMNTTPSSFTDTLFCTIDTSRVEDMERDKTTAGAIRTMLEKAIRGIKNQENWRCRAVTVDPKKENRIRIACRDEAEH